jgi:hypothetical protein
MTDLLKTKEPFQVGLSENRASENVMVNNHVPLKYCHFLRYPQSENRPKYCKCCRLIACFPPSSARTLPYYFTLRACQRAASNKR